MRNDTLVATNEKETELFNVVAFQSGSPIGPKMYYPDNATFWLCVMSLQKIIWPGYGGLSGVWFVAETVDDLKNENNVVIKHPK